MKKFSALSILLLAATLCFGADGGKSTLSLFFENDIGFSDRYYTNGLKIQYTRHLETSSNAGCAKFASFAVGQGMFVPQTIEDPTPPLDDRPYAGWLYLNAACHAVTENTLDTFAVTLGCIGRYSYAQDVQSLWHNAWGFKRPKGWDNQLDNEVGFVLTYKHSQRLYKADLGGGINADLTGSVGCDLGNVLTQGYLSILARAGFNLDGGFDFGKIDYASSCDTRAPTDCASATSWRLFLKAGALARFVGYDITLDGNVFGSSPYGVNSEWFVFEPVCGLTLARANFAAELLLNYRTREFTSQRIAHHTFWTFSVKYSF